MRLPDWVDPHGWAEHALAGAAVAAPALVAGELLLGIWTALVVGVAHEQAQAWKDTGRLWSWTPEHVSDALAFLPLAIAFALLR